MNWFSRLILLIGLVLLHMSCEAPSPSPESVATAPLAVQEGYAHAPDGVRVFYRAVGSGPDTVVVIHGGPGLTMDYFAEDLEPLAATNTLIFYDQRGTGRSSLVTDSAALDAKRFAEDLESLRNHFGLERVTLLGHSWGAGVVAVYAAQYPERIGRLIIVGGIPPQRQPLVEAFQELEASRDTTTLRQMREWREARVADPGDANACRSYYALWFTPFYGDSSAARRSKGDFCAGTAESRANKIRSVDRFTMASLGDWDWRLVLSAIPAPALIIHGTADVLPVAGAQAWAAALPDARLLLLDGVGHFPYVELPEVFFSAVKDFIHGTWPEGALEVAGL